MKKLRKIKKDFAYPTKYIEIEAVFRKGKQPVSIKSVITEVWRRKLIYSEDIIEEVRGRSDIVDVISGYVRLTRKGSSYFGLCPFHNEKSPSFSVSGSKQMFYCFGCGEGGNVFSFIMKYENYTFLEAVRMLADRAGVQLPEVSMSPDERKQQDFKAQLYEINKEAALFYYKLLKSPGGQRAYDYFKNKRMLSDETIVHFGLGASGTYKDELYRYMKGRGYSDELLKETGLFIYNEREVRDRFFNRAMFPIMNQANKVIGFGGRVMGDGEPKYLNSPETKVFDKSRNLFGLNIARSSRKKNLIICEGYMDVIALHQAGFDQAVASLGTSLTTGHTSLMKRYTSDVLVCYDSDGAGTKAAIRAIGMLRNAGLRTKVIDMRPYKDPDEFIKNLGAEAFQERIDSAKNSFMFELSVLERDFDLQDPDGRTAFLNEAAKKLVDFSDEVERNNYIATVASAYHIGVDSLTRLVGKWAAHELASGKRDNRSEYDDGGTVNGITAEGQGKSRGRASGAQEKDDGIKKAQRLLLTWLIEEPKLYAPVAKYVKPEDFTEELYYKVALILFDQFEKGGPNPAKIISSFTDEESHKEVARLFNTELTGDLDVKEKNNALDDIVKRIVKNSLDVKSKNVKDFGELQQIVDKQNEVNTLHISLN